MYCNYIENTNRKIDFKKNFTIIAHTLNYSIHIKYMVSGKKSARFTRNQLRHLGVLFPPGYFHACFNLPKSLWI